MDFFLSFEQGKISEDRLHQLDLSSVAIILFIFPSWEQWFA